MSAQATSWTIWVSGYGGFEFTGTEAEAEDMRKHKAQWERGNGFKWRTDLLTEYDRLTKKCVDLWASGEGVPQSLLRKRAKAKELAASC